MSLNPGIDPLLDRADALARTGDYQAAIAVYNELLQNDPNHLIGLNNFGLALNATQQYRLAQTAFEKAIALDPSIAEIHHNLAEALQLQKLNAQAIHAYRAALRLNPKLTYSQNNLGSVLLAEGRVDEAIGCLTRLLVETPDYSDAVFNLGLAYQASHEHELAIRCFQSLAGKFDSDSSLWLRLGESLHQIRALDDAIAACRRSLQLNWGNTHAHYLLGTIYHDGGRIDEAIHCFVEACRLSPGYCTATLVNELQHACRWDVLDKYTGLLFEQLADDKEHDPTSVEIPIDPFIVVTLAIPSTTKQQAIAARRFSAWVQSQVPKSIHDPKVIAERSERRSQWSGNDANQSIPKRLRLGYLSSDFCEHATAYLIADLFRCHDRTRFEITAYSCGSDSPSPIRNKVMANVDRFVDLDRFSNRKAAQQILEDKIDILVDLKGYTQRARPEVLAYRPAPIQLHYLGYPGPINADFIDAALVDKHIVSTELLSEYRERLVYLDGCYQANLALDEPNTMDLLTRESQGLPSSGFVFCAFHSSYKISPPMFDTWMRLLREVEGSVLWLLHSNASSVGNLRREAQQRGIDTNRLVFAPLCSHESHLKRLQLADLFLDTFPVNAHTTASDALRQGVPIVTLSGETFVSRVAGSLLSEVGLDDCITHSYDEYKSRAKQFALHPEQAGLTRRRLAAQIRQSSLFRPEAMARKIEDAYLIIWRDYVMER